MNGLPYFFNRAAFLQIYVLIWIELIVVLPALFACDFLLLKFAGAPNSEICNGW
jgi:hypothetical protein